MTKTDKSYPDFVTISQAKKLKMLGYRELAMDYYCNGEFNGGPFAQNLWDDWNDDSRQEDPDYKFFTAPHVYDAIKWLREVHGIYIEVRFKYEGLFKIVALSEKHQLLIYSDLEFKDYYDAQYAAVDLGLKCVEDILAKLQRIQFKK